MSENFFLWHFKMPFTENVPHAPKCRPKIISTLRLLWWDTSVKVQYINLVFFFCLLDFCFSLFCIYIFQMFSYIHISRHTDRIYNSGHFFFISLHKFHSRKFFTLGWFMVIAALSTLVWNALLAVYDIQVSSANTLLTSVCAADGAVEFQRENVALTLLKWECPCALCCKFEVL